jgi:hypothetical protein
MRRGNFDSTAGFCNAKKFCHERHYIRHVFGDVPANNLVKFVVWKWIWNRAEIVNHIGVRPGV